MSGTALILAGHGSHISANTGGIVWAYVDRLRSWAVADEITACFWKEAPAFSQVLDTVEANDVVIVPVFSARGYFTSDVLPSELGLSGECATRDGKTIRLTRPVGEHPKLQSIVEGRLRATIERFGLQPEETAAAIIGHGTRRNRQSRDSARHQARRIRELNWLSEAIDAYLDDEPDIPSVYRRTRAANIIALPYFVADGSHVRQDIPRALGIAELDTVNRVEDRAVYYCEPVGSDESVPHLILDLARETGLPFERKEAAGEWRNYPRAGRRALLQALESETILQFGQVMVSHESAWHCANRERGRAITSPAALRAYAREDPFRALATSADLPAGWRVDLGEPNDAQAVIETVYPGLVADWAASRRGSLKCESLQEIGLRQNGMFKDIHRLPPDVIEMTLDKICGNCVREPAWWSPVSSASAALPCRSACNLWLTTARQLESGAS
ncbi:MAG: DR2241 family protein [Chloroflexota bacterium]|nr:DR2241 family protein [Chloroflexota bacterium]